MKIRRMFPRLQPRPGATCWLDVTAVFGCMRSNMFRNIAEDLQNLELCSRCYFSPRWCLLATASSDSITVARGLSQKPRFQLPHCRGDALKLRLCSRSWYLAVPQLSKQDAAAKPSQSVGKLLHLRRRRTLIAVLWRSGASRLCEWNIQVGHSRTTD